MSQYWGPPNYPPPRPPQYQSPGTALDVYYPPIDNSDNQKWLYFLAGSCSTLILVGCCFLALVVAWIIDIRLGITTGGPATPQAAVIMPPTPIPNNTFIPTPTVPNQVPPTPTTPANSPISDAPFKIGQAVIANDVSIELIVLDIQRNVQPNNVQTDPGMEFVAISVQLRSFAATPFAKRYSPVNFQLQNIDSVLYPAHPQADNGRRLPEGELADGQSVEGDILFQIPQGQSPLFLVWQATGSAEIYVVALQ